MALTKQEWLSLEKEASELRQLCLQTTNWAGSGHMGGSLSSVDILTLLYYKYMNFDPKNCDDPDRDRCVVSKGHIGLAIASLFAKLGLIEVEQLKTFNLTGSKLGIHLDSNKVRGLDTSTGSLGHGSALALGITLAARVKGKKYKTFLLLGDGECDEGSVWEAAMATSNFKATDLITIVDRNKMMIDGKTEEVMQLEPFADKWTAFGFDVVEVDGHNLYELSNALEYAIKAKEKPVCIIANTVKGEGISYMAGNYKWHYGAVDEDKFNTGKKDLEEYYQKRLARVEKEGK
ncbi:MAG: transketolase [Clostridia bacterium]|nr:transketolase [Clostridia bacterium]